MSSLSVILHGQALNNIPYFSARRSGSQQVCSRGHAFSTDQVHIRPRFRGSGQGHIGPWISSSVGEITHAVRCPDRALWVAAAPNPIFTGPPAMKQNLPVLRQALFPASPHRGGPVSCARLAR
jgi:hypothetical protein